MKKPALLYTLISALIFAGCAWAAAPVYIEQERAMPEGPALATVHFIDVGQGDAALLQGEDGAAVLIDAGEAERAEALIAYLRQCGVTNLDMVVATHPHSDHIGGMPAVLAAFPVKRVLMPDAAHTTKTFEKLVDALAAKDIPVTKAVAGEAFEAGGMSFTVVAPCGGDYDDLNNFSACLRMTCGDATFLFTGDAEKISEEEMLASGRDISATVLKVGHHGSGSGTTAAFLAMVRPQMAVISCGEGNSYGHPHENTLNVLANADVDTYRTDELGTVVMATDGASVWLDSAD